MLLFSRLDMEEPDMIKTKIGVSTNQIKPFQMCKGADILHIEKNEGTHYSAKTDRAGYRLGILTNCETE